MTEAGQVRTGQRTGRASGRRRLWLMVPFGVSALLHGWPWARLVLAPGWPAGPTAALTGLAVLAAVGLPTALLLGHGRGVRWAIAVGDLWLGMIWQFFVWTTFGEAVRVGLWLAGVPDPARARLVALAVVGWTVSLLAWGAWRALGPVAVRVLDFRMAGLGAGFDGLRSGQLTDTHLGPFLPRRWTERIVAQVNALDVDLLVHTGDLVDGPLAVRAHQVEPLGAATARLGRLFITGNHEYFSGAAEWTGYMTDLGWTVLRNEHLVLHPDGPDESRDELVVAGIDDRTAARSGVPGHGADLDRALAGAPTGVPVILLAHQPKQV